MSDGNAEDASALMRQIYEENFMHGLKVHTIMFGQGGAPNLQNLSAQAGSDGQHHHATTNGLRNVFTNIANDCTAMDGMIKRFGELVSKLVANKVMLDHL